MSKLEMSVAPEIKEKQREKVHNNPQSFAPYQLDPQAARSMMERCLQVPSLAEKCAAVCSLL
jgi:hypothetical protein